MKALIKYTLILLIVCTYAQAIQLIREWHIAELMQQLFI